MDLTQADATLAGFLTGLALIVAVGAQNAFVLRQGIRRQHVAVIVAICAVSDAFLISAGIAGLAGVVTSHPPLLTAIRWLGVAFLAAYGAQAAVRARRPGALDLQRRTVPSRTLAVVQALAFTFLNPHVYLDTVLLIGSLANTHGDARWMFGLGAGLASIVWFSALGFGSRRLAPLLTSPRAWQVLDLVIAGVMFALAALLAFG